MTKVRPYGQAHWTFARDTLAETPAGTGVGQSDFDGFFDVCALEFDKDAQLTDPEQLGQAAAAIKAARAAAGGAVVVVFAHGWRNNADWDCANFVSFRRLMASMTKREVERYDETGAHRARRVVGVYLGWEGANDDGLLSTFAHHSFANYFRRDARARDLAASEDIIDALEQLVKATKDPANGTPDNSPMILAGHSMGGLIMESALAYWMMDHRASLPGHHQQASADASKSVFSLTIDGQPWAGPDLVLLINAASKASDTQALSNKLVASNVRKRTHIDGMTYEPPLVISVTSEDDTDVGWKLPIINFLQGLPKSAGFTPEMHTHTMQMSNPQVVCQRAGWLWDMGQHWHQLSVAPETRQDTTPTMRVALPNDADIRQSHTEYELRALPPHDGTNAQPAPLWILQVPGAIIGDHNDIFNFQAASFFLALAQMSGSIVSLNYDWPELFNG